MSEQERVNAPQRLRKDMQTGRRDLIGLKERRRGLEGPCECVSERELEIKGASAREGGAELGNPEAISASICLSVRLLPVV